MNSDSGELAQRLMFLDVKCYFFFVRCDSIVNFFKQIKNLLNNSTIRGKTASSAARVYKSKYLGIVSVLEQASTSLDFIPSPLGQTIEFGSSALQDPFEFHIREVALQVTPVHIGR